MLTLTIFLPLAGLVALLLSPRSHPGLARAIALTAAGLTLALLIAIWIMAEPGGGYQFVERRSWITSLGISYAVGLDGMSLPLVLLTGILFFAALIFSWPEDRRPRQYYAWFLFLETACLGVFAALDLFLFYIFWDLALVGMYFIIAIWGHENARAAALKFFIYTFVGSLALLLGIIGLYLGTEPNSMDMAAITRQAPLDGGGWVTSLIFFALLIGFGVKTPVVPVHTWLPPAHVEAPSPGSVVLAGVMLKMGTYGFLRILLPMMPETAAQYALLLVIIGVISVIYGALVALAQSDLKRLIAYTSVNHMGYIILAVGAVAMTPPADEAARVLAIDGAVLQMVSHGLITGSLFLLAGVIWRRTETFEIAAYGGLAKVTPLFAGAFALASFASLGLPGLAGFVAEFQIFVGVFGIFPVAAAIALLGVVITASLFLWTIQRLLLGPVNERWSGLSDLSWYEGAAILPLLLAVVAIGLMPVWILDVIEPFGSVLAALFAG